ncbi:ATP synthase F0 subunit C [Candidatus Margulisiibacteriota bacterium]
MENIQFASGMAYLGAGLAMGLVGIGTALGLSGAYQKTIENIARQPELTGTFRTLMFIGFAFIEAIALYALVVAFMLMGK